MQVYPVFGTESPQIVPPGVSKRLNQVQYYWCVYFREFLFRMLSVRRIPTIAWEFHEGVSGVSKAISRGQISTQMDGQVFRRS